MPFAILSLQKCYSRLYHVVLIKDPTKLMASTPEVVAYYCMHVQQVRSRSACLLFSDSEFQVKHFRMSSFQQLSQTNQKYSGGSSLFSCVSTQYQIWEHNSQSVHIPIATVNNLSYVNQRITREMMGLKVDTQQGQRPVSLNFPKIFVMVMCCSDLKRTFFCRYSSQ